MTTEQERTDRGKQSDNRKLRTALNDAYAALEAEKYTNSAVAFTFEEAVDLQLQRLVGPGSRIRPSQRERVDKIELELVQAVEQIKQIPPEKFLRSTDLDVNTRET